MSRFFHPDDEPDRYPESAPPEDDELPVLDDIVTPGRDGITEPTWARQEIATEEDDPEARLAALLGEIVDLALDDALDRLRPELHARLCDHLEQRLPELLAASRELDDD